MASKEESAELLAKRIASSPGSPHQHETKVYIMSHGIHLHHRALAILILFFSTQLAGQQATPTRVDQEAGALLTRQQALADIRTLSEVLESAHPDPYSAGGGKVAYHRRLQRLMRGVPESGLSAAELHARLQPFIASLGDGHTSLPFDASTRSKTDPGGIPLYFEVVDQRLWVAAVASSDQLDLIGATLEAVEAVPFAELVQRESLQRGHDNAHHALSSLAGFGALYFAESLRRLVPEWEDSEQIIVRLRRPSGHSEDLLLRPGQGVAYPLLRRESKVDLPKEAGSFAYHFLDEAREIAFLRIDNMTSYREMFEYSRALGSSGWEGWARRLFERLHGETAPSDLGEVIAAIPSATETFSGLFRAMREAGSRTLIVDLSRNYGGNDLMVQILLYFLVGFDETVALAEQTATIRKLSPLLAASSQSGLDPAEIDYSDSVPLTSEDYDFSGDFHFMPEATLDRAIRERFLRMFAQMPSFYTLFRTRQQEAAYRPERIVVLCSNATQSSGFDLMTQLYRLGAVIVGVPSSQAGNGSGDIRRFELTHSRLVGYVSTKYFLAFPEQPSTGFTLEPHHTLTYPKLARYDFDSHANLLLALDVLETTTPGAAPAR
jgi:hypothetical protein